MRELHRPLLRLAQAICASYQEPDDSEPLRLPLSKWRLAESLLRQIHVARKRGWRKAAEQQQDALRFELTLLRNDLSQLERSLGQPPVTPPTLADMYGELQALTREFPTTTYSFEEQTLSVITEPIVLRSTRLGPFEIRLSWDTRTYRVIAQEPAPAATDESVTHPHVQDESLCEGNGQDAIARALRQDRLFDFFQLVVGILRTYNPNSPFVAIDEWEGIHCSDCGSAIRYEEQTSCEHCEVRLCDECSRYCESCNHSYCSSCVVRCRNCQQTVCRACGLWCSCDARYCPSCYKSKGCQVCHEESENDRTAENDSTTSDAAVHAHRLGETALPA